MSRRRVQMTKKVDGTKKAKTMSVQLYDLWGPTPGIYIREKKIEERWRRFRCVLILFI
jgi:hypothetical protein